MMKKATLFFLFLTLFVFQCGKQGPLALEPENPPPAVENLQLRQIGNRIQLEWSFPAALEEGQIPFEITKLRRVSVYYSAKELAADKFRKRAELRARIKPGELRGGDGRSSCAITFKIRELNKQRHFFALLYEYDHKTSPLSPIAAITTLTPPQPIRDLKLEHEQKVVVLSWSKPSQTVLEQPLADIGGYRVYRRIRGEINETDFRLISAQPVAGEYFEDANTGYDGDYSYLITSVLNSECESDYSNPVSSTVKDLYPPDTPVNLVAFAAADHLLLSWQAVKDDDLSHYRLYRKLAKEDDFTLVADQIAETFFKDTKVRKGSRYFYTVAAVDRKGNESEPSSPAAETFD